MRKTTTRFVVLVGVGLSIGACSNGPTCEPLQSLEQIGEREKIKVPEGLDPLDPTRALKIPVATSPPRESDACLDAPPRLKETGL